MVDLSQLIRYRMDPSYPPTQHGQGQVWKVHDLLFNRPAALKLIDATVVLDDSSRLQFQKEAIAGARLARQHPNIVEVFDLDAVDNHLYFVMEWLAGGTLQERSGKIPFREALLIM